MRTPALVWGQQTGSGTYSESMRIDAKGKVGIGTTAPLSVLELSVTGTNSALLLPRDTTANRPAGNVTNGMMRYNTTDSKFEFYQAGSWVNFAPTTGANSGFMQGGNSFGQVATLGTTDTANLNIITGNSTRMTIVSTGNVGIGITTPSELLEVNGNVKATAFVSTSDRRLKTDIRPAPGLEAIRRLNGVQYKWKATGDGDGGVIAQEVEEVFPDAVRTDSRTGYKGVKYQFLFAPLIESVKQLYGMCRAQDAQIEQVQKRLATIEEENAKLKKENEDLKKRMEAVEKVLGIGK